MILTADNIVHYLIDKKIVSAESVVDGDCVVVDMTRRNRNFKVLRKAETGFFVKQVKTFDALAVSSLAREAQSYRLAKLDPGFRSVSGLMPRILSFDPQQHILVMELFPGCEDLASMYQRTESFPLRTASALGAALGAYHREVDFAGDGVDAGRVFPRALPWMMTLTLPYIQQVKNTDAHHRQFFGILEQYPTFLDSIDRMRAEWQVNGLIHGDMKWENCIVYNGEIKIIDWEMADLGDLAWDAGSIFQNFLFLWAGREAPATGAYSLEAMQPAIAAFWNAYTTTLSVEGASQTALLEKCCRFAAVRLLQTVYEYMQFTKRLDRAGILMLQLSMNILKDPAEAAGTLLGI